jgi:hypothetical protein
LEKDLISGRWVAIVLAIAVAIVVFALLVADEFVRAGLFVVVFGFVVAIGGPSLESALDARSGHRRASRCEAAISGSGYEAGLADLTLPSGLGEIRVKVYRPQDPTRVDCLAYREACCWYVISMVAWEHVRRTDRHADTPATKRRLARTLDSRATVVAEPRSGAGR